MSKYLHSALMRVRPAILAVFLKKLLRIRRQLFIAQHGTFLVDPVSNFGYRLMNRGVYEEEILEIMTEVLFSGGVFYDIGANEGYFTCVSGQIVGPTGLVVSVEPQSRLANIVKRNVELNNLRNVSLITTAISDVEGSAEIFLSPDINTGSSGLSQFNKLYFPTEIVAVTTLNRLCEQFGSTKIDLMKIDIESFEWEAIFGSKSLFRSRLIKNIAIEIHDNELLRRHKCSADIVDFLMSCGYTFSRRGEVHFFKLKDC